MMLWKKQDKEQQLAREFDRGYLLGLLTPEKYLPELTEKFEKMKLTKGNIKTLKRIAEGYYLGVSDGAKLRRYLSVQQTKQTVRDFSKGTSRTR